jgi:antitoxin CcdA
MRIIDAHIVCRYNGEKHLMEFAMQISSEQEISKRRPVNLTIREDVLHEAKSLKLNTSKAAETGIINAVKEARAKKWLEENQSALQAHNKRIDKEGTLLKPSWVTD